MIDPIVIDIPKGIWWTSNHRLHWRASSEKTAAIRMITRSVARGTPSTQKADVIAIVSYPTRGRADPSNASPVVKAALDGLVDAGVFPDDDSEHVLSVTYVRGVATGKRGLYRLTLVVRPAV